MADRAQQTAILVFGMHRSGTSATTRVVNLLGAELGSDLLPPAEDNPGGFWEHRGAYRIHERLLSALGRTWHDVSEMPANWIKHPAAAEALSDLQDLIQTEFKHAPMWAVKDPRMCRLASLWIRATQNLGIKSVALIATRNPMEIARSLHVRDGWSHQHAYLMTAQHFLGVVDSTRQIPRAIVSYESLMDDWSTCMSNVAAKLGIQWPRSVEEVGSEISKFIDPTNYRNHSATLLRASSEIPAPPKMLEQLYFESKQVEAGNASWEKLDELLGSYEVAAEIFAGPLAGIESQLKDLQKDVQRLGRDVHVWEAEAKSVQKRFEELSQEKSKLDEAKRLVEEKCKQESAELKYALQASERESLQKSEEISRLGGRLNELDIQLSQAQSSLVELQVNAQRRLWLMKQLFLTKKV